MTTETADTDALDARVAEGLMGYVWRVHHQDGQPARSLHPPGAREDAPLATGDEPLYVSWIAPERPGLSNVPDLSTTPEGERMVRDALLVRGYQVKVHLDSDGTGGVTLWGDHKRTHVSVTDANTPRAMTEAALAALVAEGR